MSVARTPEQNGVVERQNRTLVEAARTMLSAAKVPLFFWAEAIATSCFTQNRSLTMASNHNISDPAPTCQTMASVQISSDPAPTCQTMASAHNSSDPAPTCQTMASAHNKGIQHQTSVARTPEQNGVVKRWNRTLVEAARTMLSIAKVPLFFWAEVIATACFTQNRSLVIPRHEKTPYQIINDQKPSVKFFYIFGFVCYIVRDGENLDKMKEKGDECIFVGYYNQSRAYRVFNKRTRVIMESIHVNFDELPQMTSDQLSSDPALECQTMALNHDNLSLTNQRQANVTQSDRIVTTSNDLDLLFSLMFDELLNGSSKASPEYVPESDFEMHPEDDDDEDPEKDAVDYPADGGDDGDDEEESSEDEEDDEMDTEPFETDESTATPPPHPAYHTMARISIPAPHADLLSRQNKMRKCSSVQGGEFLPHIIKLNFQSRVSAPLRGFCNAGATFMPTSNLKSYILLHCVTPQLTMCYLFGKSTRQCSVGGGDWDGEGGCVEEIEFVVDVLLQLCQSAHSLPRGAPLQKAKSDGFMIHSWFAVDTEALRHTLQILTIVFVF
nr:retrovirus-related Pol polyprotein from transposon TNT 1-94 [Tanacetum cinerariifolium]